MIRDYNIFLDDFRIPLDAFAYTGDSDFLKLKWEIVRSYDEFVKLITDKYKDSKFPELISFDHDLDDAHYDHTKGDFPYEDMTEKTGFHCAKWLVDFCIDNSNQPLPMYKVHSMNPVGKSNIQGLLVNFSKFQHDQLEKLR